MHKYLVTSTMTVLPWIHPVLKFFFMNALEIATNGLRMPSLDGTLSPVLNIIFAIKFGYLPPIQFELEKLSLGFPTNSSCQLP